MVKRVGIVAKVRLESIAPHLLEVAAWLEARGVEPVFETETAALAAIGAPRRVVSRYEMPEVVDLLLILGGDGTLLAMADRIAHAGRDLPILGVIVGRVSFLCSVTLENLAQALMACPALEEKEASEELFFPMETKDMQAAWEAWGVLDPFGPGHEEPFVGVTGLLGRGRPAHGRRALR